MVFRPKKEVPCLSPEALAYTKYMPFSYAEADEILAHLGRDGIFRYHTRFQLARVQGGQIAIRFCKDQHQWETLGVFSPDNTFRFTMSQKTYHLYHQSFSILLARYSPFMGVNKNKHDKRILPITDPTIQSFLRRVEVARENNNRFYSIWEMYTHVKFSGYRYVEGLTFDMTTGKALEQADNVARFITHKKPQKEWRAILKNYRRACKSAAKLGLIRIVADKHAGKVTTYSYYDRINLYTLLDIMQRKVLTVDDVTWLAFNTAPNRWNNAVTAETIQNDMQTLPSRLSERLRKHLGVIEDNPEYGEVE